MIRIVLADDHTLVRQALIEMLEQESDFQVVGEAENGFDALAVVKEQKPDILIVDLMMPRLNGLEVTSRVKTESAKTRVIVLSMRKSEPYILEAFRNGADGYVFKSEEPEDLLEAIRTVAGGRTFLSESVAKLAADAYIARSQKLPEDKYGRLTAREKEVLQLSAEGMSGGQIAEFLTLSVYTVATHRRNLMSKIDVKNQAELVNFARSRGITNDF